VVEVMANATAIFPNYSELDLDTIMYRVTSLFDEPGYTVKIYDDVDVEGNTENQWFTVSEHETKATVYVLLYWVGGGPCSFISGNVPPCWGVDTRDRAGYDELAAKVAKRLAAAAKTEEL